MLNTSLRNKAKASGILWLAFALLLACTDKGNNREVTINNEKYSIVSNTHGEIGKILIKTVNPDHYWMKYYDGLRRQIDSTKIIGVLQIIPLNRAALEQLHYSNPLFPSTIDSVLVKAMGIKGFNKLKKDYQDTMDFDGWVGRKSSKNFIPDKIAPQLKKDIIKLTEAYSKINFIKLHQNDKMPELVVIPDIDGEFLQPVNENYDSIPHMFFIQDAFHAAQVFDKTKPYRFIYSEKIQDHATTVRKLKSKFLSKVITEIVSYDDFDGGNVLPTDDYVLIGNDTRYANTNVQNFETKLCSLFNVKNIIFTGMNQPIENLWTVRNESGKLYQPVFHIDMFLTPAGKTTNGKNLVFVGKVDPSLYIQRYLTKGKRDVIDTLNKLIQISIDNMIASGRHKNIHFEIVEIPLFVSFTEGVYESGEKYDKIMFYASFNNAIVEIKEHSKNILFSDYLGIDRYNNRYFDIVKAKYKIDSIMKKYNFTYDFISPPADSLGDAALHCYTKVIWREQE